MEWVLQFVDEIDDAIGVMRHGWLGIHARIEVLLRRTRPRALVNDGQPEIV